MLALDLDGTILLPDGSASDRTVAAIGKAAAAGYRICVATGRSYTESRSIIQRLSLRDECIFVGGAMVIDTASDRTLHRTTMHPQVAAEVCAVMESMGHAALALQDPTQAGLDYLISKNIPLRPASKSWMDAVKMNINFVPNLGQYRHEHTLRVGLCCESEEAQAILETLHAKFGNRTMMHRLKVPGSNCEVLEVFDPAVSKWEGISFVIRRHHIAPEQVVAVGDDMNDLQMIRHSGLGVAMGNAHEEVKKAADLVIGPALEDGLAEFIEDLLRGKYDVAA